jgi:acyl-CoA reductase-like NAD-dependent aldehyde dehydrogenase
MFIFLHVVVLELGGKDPFVICDDADVKSIIQTACRGVWQNMGQNCAGNHKYMYVGRLIYIEKHMYTYGYVDVFK